MGVSLFLTYIMANLSGSGWWTWIGELIPDRSRAGYFGKRSSLAQLMNILLFFTANWFLDAFENRIFLVYSIIYFIIGLLGTADIVLHTMVPEPESANERKDFRVDILISPLQDRRFLLFALISGFSMLSILIPTPFLAPHITSPATVGAPNIWLGIMYFISQLTWMAIAPFWGVMMDRMGQKPIVLLGLLHVLAFPLYLLLTASNYLFLLPCIAVWTGIFGPAYWEGLNQFMLALLPRENRTAYVAWYWAFLGIIGSGGTVIGGYIMEHAGLTLTIGTCTASTAVSFLLFSRLKTPSARLEHVISMIAAPSVYRTYARLAVLSGTLNPGKAHKALKDISRKSGALAFEEVISRMDDPDRRVREEAVFAMGRIGTPEARDVLTAHLADPESLIRPEAAAALGDMQDLAAVPPLIDALYTGDEELQEEAALALGKLQSEESVKALRQLIQEDRSQRVKVSGIEGIAHQKKLDAVEEIMDLWEHTSNTVLRRQLSISLGNLIGNPGEFYRCITGTAENRENAVSRLFQDVNGGIRKLRVLDAGYVSHILNESLPAVEELYLSEHYGESYSVLSTIIFNLIFRKLEMMGFEGDPREGEVFLKEKDSFLYLGYHVTSRLERFREEQDAEPKPADILLGLYFLKHYCKRESRSRKGTDHKPSPYRNGQE